MNADQLLTYYDRIADAPEAIARLRHFILDLAVRGKLVPQDPNDEPVSELLKRITAEKARLIGTREIQHGKLKKFDLGTVPFELPLSWEWTVLGDVFLYDAGIKREPKTLEPKKWLLELEDIEKDTSRLLVRVRVHERSSLSTKSEFLVGDILYGKLRPYLNKVLVADEDGYSTTEIVAIRPFIPLCSDYCAIALRRPDFVDYVTRLGQGTKMPRLRTEDAVSAPFPLPPLAEQHRIVIRVDELMKLCDQLEAARANREATRNRLAAASLARLNQPDSDPQTLRDHAAFTLKNLAPIIVRPDQVKALRQTILNLAVRGKLVSPNLNDESIQLALTAADKQRKETAKSDPRADAETQELLAGEARWDVPNHWSWRGLADLVLFVDYRGNTPLKTTSGVRLITAKNVRQGFISLMPEEFVSEQTYQLWMRRGFPKQGDVLFTTEAPMGNAAVIDITEEFALAQRIICFQPYGATNSDVLTLQLLSEPFQAILNITATGLTAKGIKAAKLKRLPIALPPLAEQQRIVTKVAILMQLCDRLEISLTDTNSIRRHLLDSILHTTLTPAEEIEKV